MPNLTQMRSQPRAARHPGLLALLVGLLSGCVTPPAKDRFPPIMLDRLIAAEAERAGLPGASFAVLRHGELVHLSAFGVADVDSGVALSPSARMRIASVSKPITAITTVRLAELQLLDLDAPVVALLAARLPANRPPHPGFARLTARHLLGHCGGFDREGDVDPMLNARRMAERLKVASPPSATTLVAWALAQPPDFAPGTRCVYSNVGYAVLGRIIEAATGMDYAQAVQVHVLQPAGIVAMRLAATLPAQRAPDEPRYHDERMVRSVFDPGLAVPLPDGGFAIEPMDAHGGWLASAADLVRLLGAVETDTDTPLLTPDGRRQMLTPPFPRAPGGEAYALGWEVAQSGRQHWHSGDLPGSTALLVREADGSAWALLANGTVRDGFFHDRLRRRIGAALRAIEW